MSKFFVLFLAALGFTASAAAKTFTVQEKRQVHLYGVVGEQAMDVAAQIVDLTNENPDDPIDIVINSPGGSVLAGLQILSAMDIAKIRGVKFRCVVPVMAASMAFQVLANCNERYVLANGMFLWHPMKTDLGGYSSAEELLYASKSIRAIEEPLLQQLIKALKISRSMFFYHYRKETVWLGWQLRKLSPGFVTVVDDVQGIGNPFDLK